MKTLIQNGVVMDPANGVRGSLNLLVEDGKVLACTQDAPQADRIIDASGCVVCPGFIDIHMHEDPLDPDGRIAPCIFETMLRMGVTTAVGGNCGLNICDPLRYLALADQQGIPVNLALFAGHEYFRNAAGAQDKYAPISLSQREHMLKGLRAALDGGCMGVSFGIRYVPGIDEAELDSCMALCSDGRGLVSVHLRDDADHLFGAVDEVVRPARKYGVSLQISHIGSMGGFGQMQRLLNQVDTLRSAGMNLACDCYPYSAFSTRIGETTYDNGWLDRYRCGYDACQLTEGKYAGMRCTKEIFEELRRDDPECITVCHVMRADEVELALRHPQVMPASDGLLDQGRGHPRAAGTFPRYLRRHVLDAGLDLYEGVRKITADPAHRLGFPQKGSLHPGADADIVIFDPSSICDRATFEQPALPPNGIRFVLVGGELAAQDGRIVNAALGRSIRAKRS